VDTYGVTTLPGIRRLYYLAHMPVRGYDLSKDNEALEKLKTGFDNEKQSFILKFAK